MVMSTDEWFEERNFKREGNKQEGFLLIIVAVWHFLPSPVTFFILLRMNTNNKKTGNKGAHPSHSPKCAFVCVRACMYSSPLFFWGGSSWLEDCIQEYISHSVTVLHEFWVSAETWLSSISAAMVSAMTRTPCFGCPGLVTTVVFLCARQSILGHNLGDNEEQKAYVCLNQRHGMMWFLFCRQCDFS